MAKAVAYFSVGKIADRCGVKVSTLHFYEQKGLIRSIRNTANQRLYTKDVLRRIALIKAAQQLGIRLEEIKQALDSLPSRRTPTQQDWNRLSKQWQQQLNQRIASMIKLRDSLTGCIGCGCLSMDNCPLYNPEDRLATQGQGAVILKKDWQLK